jgi:cell division protein DivIC
MSMLKKIFRVAKNRYFLVTLFALSWIIFFDRYNLMKRVEDEVELHKLKQEREYYVEQIKMVEKNRDELLSNPQSLERFARERYFMKKDNEEVYIVGDEKPQEVSPENEK